MKTLLLVAAAVALASTQDGTAVHPQAKAMGFTYQAGSTAAYPPGTGLIYNAGTTVKHPAGTSVMYPYGASVRFPFDTEYYTKGPVSVLAGTNITFPSNTQVAYGPGTQVLYTSNNAETRYQQWNGNTHTIVQYPATTNAQYYCGSNCNLILFSAGTNPLVYYNPGGSTQFGASALPVETEFDPDAAPTARTYGRYYGGGGGYSYCSGYSSNGWPSTTYRNYNTGYRATCQQTGPNSYNYPPNNSTGGGYSMGGGSCYGNGNYYGGYGGGGNPGNNSTGGGGYGK